MSKEKEIGTIIHGASVAAAGIGAGLSQLPGSDMPLLCSIQAGMIASIATLHGTNISKSIATDLVMTFSAGYTGRAISQWLVGWIPGWGNAINASTAAGITEAIGWSADAYFNEESKKSA